MIASVVSVGYQSPIEQQASSKNVASAAIEAVKPSVDQILAADLAASTALMANLSIASNASNLSISLNAKSELAQTSDTVLSKPLIVQNAGDHRGVVDYVTVTGDTVTSVATRFSITPQTLKWANQLTSDALPPGRTLAIPGTDGVVYTVKNGDSIDSVAAKYSVTVQRIVTYNDLELSGITPGQRIVLPDGVLPGSERPESLQSNNRSTPVRGQSFTYAANAASVGNRYDYGYCTWYAYNRRAELGRPVGSFWGNAATWAGFARSSGYVVNNTPAVGAVMQNGGGYGHVAVVESVGSDDSITVSEMNYAGWNVISTRTISLGQASSYNFIH